MTNLFMQGSFKAFIILFVISLTACQPKQSEKTTVETVATDTSASGKKLAEISREITAHPADAELFYSRAKIHLARKDVANALLDMKKAVALDSSKATYYITLADAFFASGDPGQSLLTLKHCLQLEPSNVIALEKTAELFLYARQYDKAIINLDAILKVNMHDAKAYFMKGICFKEQGDTNRAVSSFQTALEQRKDYYEPYMQLGIIYTARNNKLGGEYYNGALRLNPKSEEAYYGRGMFYQEVIHDYDKAIQDYTTITQLNPKNANAYYNLGYVHFQFLKVYSEALRFYTEAIQLSPDWPEAFFNRGLTYETLGNVAAAESDYRAALKLRPDYPKAAAALQRVTKPI